MTTIVNDKKPIRLAWGKIKVHPDGFGFVVPEDGMEDIHVAAKQRGAAMDSDKVEVSWWVGARGLEGKVEQVLERGRGKLTGELLRRGGNLFFRPDDPRISARVAVKGGIQAPEGLSVVARIVAYPETPEAEVGVEILKVLGKPDDPLTEVEKTVACADINDEFATVVTDETARIADHVRLEDRADRADLRHIPFATIDPETARDFDDAVALESLPQGGHRLWVAVADVSHYLREGTALDAEARLRGVSVYLPSRAIPMLPEALSAHLCSLVPNEDRLAMVTRIDYDRQLAIVDVDFCAAVIHSHGRLDYPGVAAALAGDTRGKRKHYEPFLPMLKMMDALARRLRVGRQARGSLDLDLPQAVVELDRDDPRLVRDIRRARRDPGEKHAYAMIEEFMLAANEAVGKSFADRNEDTLWRVHDIPDTEKVASFAEMALRHDIPFNPDDAQTPLGLSKVLVKLKGHKAQTALSSMLLRTLRQATYDVANLGHFGLASEAYVHFTSPIRRYPDVVAHRLLKHRLASLKKPAGGFPPMEKADMPTRDQLQAMANAATFCERRAMEVEREVVDLYRAYFMRNRVGDILEGAVSGVTGFGLFVTVDEPFVEGLVRMEYLTPDDFYDFDPASASLVGRHSGSTFTLGDRVSVEILQVSVARRRIELRLAKSAAKKSDRKETRRPARKGKSDAKAKPARVERRKTKPKESTRRKKR